MMLPWRFIVVVGAILPGVVHGIPGADSIGPTGPTGPIGPFNITAKLTKSSEAVLEKWIELGSPTRLDILPTFDPQLGLPEDAYLCPLTDGELIVTPNYHF